MPLNWRIDPAVESMQAEGRKRPVINERRSAADNADFGTLYVVATPVGNLEDVTLRALKILRQADLIAAEKVRHTQALCRHYGIKTRLTGYRRDNRKGKTPDLLRRLKSGSDIALVADAGTPGISDPGAYLIDRAAREGIRVAPVPGPSAVSAALSIAGLAAESFVFAGFLPTKAGKRKKVLQELRAETRTLVFFEAPHRLRAMLSDLAKHLGDRHMVMVREMTKVFEEIQRGTVGEILQKLPEESLRGEFTLVVAGSAAKAKAAELSAAALERIEACLQMNKMSLRDIARQVAQEEGLTYRTVYRACLAKRKNQDRSVAHGKTEVDGVDEDT
jgi:16S rRNA (cytidine1402-2'-O)-methyltransferase